MTQIFQTRGWRLAHRLGEIEDKALLNRKNPKANREDEAKVKADLESRQRALGNQDAIVEALVLSIDDIQLGEL